MAARLGNKLSTLRWRSDSRLCAAEPAPPRRCARLFAQRLARGNDEGIPLGDEAAINGGDFSATALTRVGSVLA